MIIVANTLDRFFINKSLKVFGYLAFLRSRRKIPLFIFYVRGSGYVHPGGKINKIVGGCLGELVNLTFFCNFAAHFRG